MTTELETGRERRVALANGVHLRIVEQGPETGEPIVLLHGWPDSSQSFEQVLPLLPGDLRVIAVDQRGHGGSDRPASGYTIEDLAGDAVALLDSLAAERAVLVGHSMGSFVARRAAERAPDRVSALVLIGTALVPGNAALRSILPAVSALTDPVPEPFVREFQESTVARPVPAAFMARVIANSQRVPARVWRAVLEGLIAYSPGRAPRCPTLVLGGTRDALFSVAEQEAAAAVIPGARLELTDGVGHDLHWEEPGRFVASLLRFVEQRDNAR